MRTNATKEELERALELVNERYDGNIRWNRQPETKGSRTRFTLRVNSARGPGARRGLSTGRHLSSACWHVHGYFFEALFKVNPSAWVESNCGTIDGAKRITIDGGNWRDRVAGQKYNGREFIPLHFSMACECNQEGG